MINIIWIYINQKIEAGESFCIGGHIFCPGVSNEEIIRIVESHLHLYSPSQRVPGWEMGRAQVVADIRRCLHLVLGKWISNY